MPKPAFHTSNLITGLTLVVSLAWLLVLVFRLIGHTFEGSGAVDSAMLLILSFWFGAKAFATAADDKKNGDEKT